MGSLVSLSQARAQVRLAEDETGEDTLLEGYIAAAERTCELRTGRFIDDAAIPAGSAVKPLDAGEQAVMRQAALLLIGHWFANRETVNVGNITSALPFGTQVLLDPLRDFTWP